MWITPYGIAKREERLNRIRYIYLDGFWEVPKPTKHKCMKSDILVKQTRMLDRKELKAWLKNHG